MAREREKSKGGVGKTGERTGRTKERRYKDVSGGSAEGAKGMEKAEEWNGRGERRQGGRLETKRRGGVGGIRVRGKTERRE